MSAVSLLCEIIAQGDKVSSGFYGRDKNYAVLVRHGFLREAGVLASVVCCDCDAPHSAPVVYEEGGYGYYCPDLGFIRRDPAQLAAIVPDVSLLISRLADSFACRQRRSSSLRAQTWRIGLIMTASVPVMLYFHPTLESEDDARDLQTALGREVRSEWRLIVTSQGTLPMPKLALVRLDDLVELDTETGELVGIMNPGVLAGVPRKNRGGRPSEYGLLLKPLIKNRMQANEAREAINAEAREIRAAFQKAHPNKSMPSDSSIKRYIREARGGS